MAKRNYGQHCGMAHAVDLVGERWALLIVRDLLVGPRRFTDLKRGLPRIPTNILTARLKELEEAGIVERRLLPRPENSVVYALSEYGADLEDVVLALGRWGARTLGEPGPEDVVTPSSLIMALRTTFQPAAARKLTASYEIRAGEIVLNLSVENGALRVDEGPAPAPDLVIETGPQIRSVMAGELTAAQAVDSGLVRISGDPALFDRFAEAFAIESGPAATH